MSTLAERLGSIREKYRKMLKPELAERLERHIEDLRRDGSVARALKAGDRAPAFTLSDQRGVEVSSARLLANGPLVVSFYRGTWCPYCNEEVSALASVYDRMRAMGAELVTITPQSAENAQNYLTQHPVPFAILVDPDAKVAEAFGLAYTFPNYLSDLYKTVFSNDLAFVNASKTWRLPFPGRYVIAPDGIIADAHVDADYRFRPDPADTLAAIARLLSATSH
jgi:peroxiredoxin